MRCDYHEAGLCHSCTWIDVPYQRQVERTRSRVSSLIPLPSAADLPVVTGPQAGFRNKAKMVVSGTITAPTLGIVDENSAGIDLISCPLYPPAMHEALAKLRDFVTAASLEPYDIQRRRGELKHVLVTISPSGEFMVRFVMRSTEALARIRKHLPALQAALPSLAVATLNVLPEHRAALEGEREIFLTEQQLLPMRLRDLTLYLQPKSFFQTNTAIAQRLYDRARALVDEHSPASVWDLYCGVGGFALHLARPSRQVVGVEVSPDAIECARLAARDAGLGDGIGTGTGTGTDCGAVRFEAEDATEFAAREIAAGANPDVVVVNPPRRGLGPRLCQILTSSSVSAILYSSCNPESLARDLAAMPDLEATAVEIFDMFPHTEHTEVLTWLARRS